MDPIVPFTIFAIFFTSIIVIIVVSIRHSIKSVKNVVTQYSDKMKICDQLEIRSFTIEDIILFDYKDYYKYILIKDTDSKTLYLYPSFFDIYVWSEGQEYYLEPKYYEADNTVYLVDNKYEDNYSLEFSKNGGKYKIVSEIGHLEVKDEMVYLYYNDSSKKPKVAKLKNVKHANMNNDLNGYHNVVLIDCFVNFDVKLEDKISD